VHGAPRQPLLPPGAVPAVPATTAIPADAIQLHVTGRTCTVALLPGVSLSLMRTIWERRMSGSAGGVVSLNVVCGKETRIGMNCIQPCLGAQDERLGRGRGLLECRLRQKKNWQRNRHAAWVAARTGRLCSSAHVRCMLACHVSYISNNPQGFMRPSCLRAPDKQGAPASHK